MLARPVPAEGPGARALLRRVHRGLDRGVDQRCSRSSRVTQNDAVAGEGLPKQASTTQNRPLARVPVVGDVDVVRGERALHGAQAATVLLRQLDHHGDVLAAAAADVVERAAAQVDPVTADDRRGARDRDLGDVRAVRRHDGTGRPARSG